ncbi:hypothetical protein [Actinoallomurus iriomotensis]|uniref:Uncharacterized protein n=1 Tax=Actinoallomurus iriomotensis TaxID=478107 RepID=A0A9W6S7S1_9ACTN|nr:hypothetical protein [Actinoallomurus iriomotensis]GLY88653.1 hypothetical protein Airi02_065820 [Actinoallomurus iriomotensis]
MSDLEAARAVADAVLYDGGRRSPDAAGRPLGLLVPPGFIAAEEPSAAQTECLLDGVEGALHVRPRFLHVRTRTAEGAAPYDEAAERELDLVWPLADLLAGEQRHEERIPGGRENADGVIRAWEPLDVRIRASAERLPGPYGVVRLRLRLENISGWTGEERSEALRRSLVAAHALLGRTGGVFLSLADPPEWARPYAEGCANLRAWPVLVADDLVLSSPIILPDRPRVAAERSGAHPVTLTDRPGEDAPVSPETDRITIAGHEVGRGSKVRLAPGGRADAQDMFVAGRTATVEAVLFDVDGSRHLAVTVDDDPGTDLRRAQGRYWYFGPEDVEPL